jgi:undecaprenyl-diphosphatase
MVRKYHALLLLLAATGGALLLSLLLKDVIDRPRPDLIAHRSHVMTKSFPSGHAMLSAAVYLTLGVLLARLTTSLRLKLYFLCIALLLTLLVGVSRVFMGVHWPTDVMAGWAAGLAWAIGCWLVARWLQRRGSVEPPQPPADPGAASAVDAPPPAAAGSSPR